MQSLIFLPLFIRAYHALFTDPQISLFNYFFIKNGSHGTFTHLKIILLQCFLVFNFQFQFSVVSKPTLKLHSACLDSTFSAESRVAFFHFFFFFPSPHFMRFALGQGTTSIVAVLFMYYKQYCSRI